MEVFKFYGTMTELVDRYQSITLAGAEEVVTAIVKLMQDRIMVEANQFEQREDSTYAKRTIFYHSYLAYLLPHVETKEDADKFFVHMITMNEEIVHAKESDEYIPMVSDVATLIDEINKSTLRHYFFHSLRQNVLQHVMGQFPSILSKTEIGSFVEIFVRMSPHSMGTDLVKTYLYKNIHRVEWIRGYFIDEITKIEYHLADRITTLGKILHFVSSDMDDYPAFHYGLETLYDLYRYAGDVDLIHVNTFMKNYRGLLKNEVKSGMIMNQYLDLVRIEYLSRYELRYPLEQELERYANDIITIWIEVYKPSQSQYKKDKYYDYLHTFMMQYNAVKEALLLRED